MIKNPPANAGDMGSISGSARFPGEGNGNLLQYSCLGNPMDRGAWQATVHGVDSQTQLSNQIITKLENQVWARDLDKVVKGMRVEVSGFRTSI